MWGGLAGSPHTAGGVSGGPDLIPADQQDRQAAQARELRSRWSAGIRSGGPGYPVIPVIRGLHESGGDTHVRRLAHARTPAYVSPLEEAHHGADRRQLSCRSVIGAPSKHHCGVDRLRSNTDRASRLDSPLRYPSTVRTVEIQTGT